MEAKEAEAINQVDPSKKKMSSSRNQMWLNMMKKKNMMKHGLTIIQMGLAGTHPMNKSYLHDKRRNKAHRN